MADQNQSKGYKKFVLFLCGCFALVLGVTLTLIWWADVVSLFRGGVGLILALGGMIVLYSLNR